MSLGMVVRWSVFSASVPVFSSLVTRAAVFSRYSVLGYVHFFSGLVCNFPCRFLFELSGSWFGLWGQTGVSLGVVSSGVRLRASYSFVGFLVLFLMCSRREGWCFSCVFLWSLLLC